MTQAQSIRTVPFFSAVNGWVRHDDEPPYREVSRWRDRWLQEFPLREPHLAGVLHGAVSIDKNRKWTLTGSERQVKSFVSRLRNFEHGQGWRAFIAKASQSYYSTDMGFVGEVVSDGTQASALYQVNNLDPSRCQLKDPYYGAAMEYAAPYDDFPENFNFLRACSMPNVRHGFHGLGFCAVSRCLELAKLMIAVYEHDKEQLLAKSPKGLLLVKGVTEQQWNKAMQDREAHQQSYQRNYYGGVKVLASHEDIEAKLVALSSLPANFNLETFTNLLMFGYALAFGYPPEEFWPVQFGSLGRGKEVEANEIRSSSKGVGNFIFDFQEQLQKHLPRSLQFEFSQRDTSGDLAEAELEGQHIENVKELFAEGIISRDEARHLLAKRNIIPHDWTPQIEEVAGSDVSRTLKERMADSESIREAVMWFPDEPVIHYEWPTDRCVTLWHEGSELLQRRVWGVPQHRAKLAEVGDVLIDDQAVDAAIAEMLPEMRQWMN